MAILPSGKLIILSLEETIFFMGDTAKSNI